MAGVTYCPFYWVYSHIGLILNHRDLLLRVSVNRNYLPGDYRTRTGFAAVRDRYGLFADSVLVYGNVGVWLTDSTVSQFAI
jgi:hypothetical protein